MNLSALLVCVDDQVARTLRQVLEELNIRAESCSDLARASIRLAQERFDAVIVDCETQAEVTALLHETRFFRANESTLTIVVMPSQESIREIFSLGVNFVLYKPVSYERALSSLRAARAVMRRDKRRSQRTRVHTHATVGYANVEEEKATLVNLSQNGMAILFGKRLPPTSKVYFHFTLPGQSSSVRLSGQLIWQDWIGLAGIQFVDVPKASRRMINDFLHDKMSAAPKARTFSGVTVELDEAMQPVGVAVEDGEAETRGDSAPEGVVDHAPLSSHDPGDRREQMRHRCRLGAQVYRTGVSVPNHCCLTDLSSGGCYLELSLPFPRGTSVEITVRTYELKLSLRGTVQASHPGYGMGIAFDLSTREQRDHVHQLINFVAASEEKSD
jgi:CheY-like chemotaxis protein